MSDQLPSARQVLDAERHALLQQLERWLDTPMLILGFVWLGLVIWELLWGLSPLLETTITVIWIIFILNFAVEFILAPRKFAYLKRNWLTTIALAVPAFRVLRIARVVRAFQATRGLRLLKVVTSLNRGMSALGASLGRRGFGYVVALTMVVTLVGAAGMYTFESQVTDGLTNYGEALWWTAMIMTTMGSQYWPQTAEGRVLCVLLALYAFAIFGYVTATLATFFVEHDAESDTSEVTGTRSITALRSEIAELRAEVQKLLSRQDQSSREK